VGGDVPIDPPSSCLGAHDVPAPQPQDDGLHVIADNLVFDHGDLWKPSAISLQLAFFDL
jgi:hypothetical protein